MPTPVAAWSKEWVCYRSPAGIASSNPADCMDFVSYEYCMCCQEEDSVTSQTHVRRSLTECGVSECDHKTSTTRRPRPTRAVEP